MPVSSYCIKYVEEWLKLIKLVTHALPLSSVNLVSNFWK